MTWQKSIMAIIGSAVLFIVMTSPVAYAQVPVPRVKPAPPGPIYLTPHDHDMLDKYFEALDEHQWGAARSWRRRVKDPVAHSVADWAWFKADPAGLDFREAGKFLDLHESWPNTEYLQKLAEKKLDYDSNPDAIRAFFANRYPISGRGKIQFARALFANGQEIEAKIVLRDGWINHDWTSRQEREILSRFGQYLTKTDHGAKADRQLFEIKATATKTLLPYLSQDDKRKMTARIALLRSDSNAQNLLLNLPEADQKDAGVLHAATRYYRRKGKELEAILWASKAPLNGDMLRNQERWWTEKRLLMRWALKNGRFDDAYHLAAYSGLTKGGSFADAEFAAGWIALRFLQDPKRAKPHFAYLDAGVTAPISKARAHYWLGRTFDAENQSERAQLHFQVASAYPYTYYGQLAYENLLDKSWQPRFPRQEEPMDDDLELFNSRPLVHALRILSDIDRDREFINFARALDDQLQTPGEYVVYEKFMMDEGMPFLSVRAGKVAFKRGADAPNVAYPVINIPAEAESFVEPALILGLSRQESEFNPRAYSSARARGLMQLLPSTAKITARKEGIPYSRARLLDDPSYNMIIGAAHLSHLIEDFRGSYILTLAGYNAGPNRSRQWIDQYGDPRSQNIDPVDWVELIPFNETRNYVMRVLENVQIYRAQLNDSIIPGKLSTDLVRGGGSTLSIGQNPPSPFLTMLAEQQSGIAPTPYRDVMPAAYKIAYQEPVRPNHELGTAASGATLANNTQSQPVLTFTTTEEAPSLNQNIQDTEIISDDYTRTDITYNQTEPIIVDTTGLTADELNQMALTETVPVTANSDKDCTQIAGTANATDLNTQALLDYLADGDTPITPC